MIRIELRIDKGMRQVCACPGLCRDAQAAKKDERVPKEGVTLLDI